MVSKNQIKFITSLRQKKYRDKSNLFIAEGPKLITDLYNSGLNLDSVYATQEIPELKGREFHLISATELQKISNLKNPHQALAVFEIPEEAAIERMGLIVALDDIRDPGNLGTIIRLCDWFGVRHLVCSPGTADCYNPKVIQATMGSIARVSVHYQELDTFFRESISQPVYGAFMDGENVYSATLPANGVLVMGNEGAGISPGVEKFIDKRIAIPRFGNKQETESLNVASATAILLSEFHRSTET